MANMRPTRSRPGANEDDAFGWQLFHDRQRNLIYYLHSYTGEVRWPRPETVGFVMHGLKPLPANAGIDIRTDPSVVNPDIWNPYYPHVVMLPSGLMQVHPGPGSETQGATEMWCGYNRFPLTKFGDSTGNGAVAAPHKTQGLGGASIMSSGPRMLPPTWEESPSGSPFLPPYPVTILGRDDTGKKRQVAPRLPRLDERFQTPEIDVPRSYHQLRSGQLGRVQGSTDWPTLTRGSTSVVPPIDRKQQEVHPKIFPAPNTEKKEHNRKGYLLRQARKLMRDNSSNSTAPPPKSAPAAPTISHRMQDVSPAANARHENSSRALQDNLEDYETISPLHC